MQKRPLRGGAVSTDDAARDLLRRALRLFRRRLRIHIRGCLGCDRRRRGLFRRGLRVAVWAGISGTVAVLSGTVAVSGAVSAGCSGLFGAGTSRARHAVARDAVPALTQSTEVVVFTAGVCAAGGVTFRSTASCPASGVVGTAVCAGGGVMGTGSFIAICCWLLCATTAVAGVGISTGGADRRPQRWKAGNRFALAARRLHFARAASSHIAHRISP